MRTSNAGPWTVYQGSSNSTANNASTIGTTAGGGLKIPSADAAGSSFDPNGGLYTDLTNATAATINALREASQIQRLFERDMRGGTRYVEILKSHFGVVSPDSRLQRPEYLGGSSVPVNIAFGVAASCI